MNRSLLPALVLASVSCLTACGADPMDSGTTSDEVGAVESALDPAEVNPYSARMSELGYLTLKCLGTVGPDTYTGKEGWLRARFDKCVPQKGSDPEQTWQLIQEALSVQFVEKDGPAAAEYMSTTWESWRARFLRQGIKSCPSWLSPRQSNDPTPEIMKNLPHAKEGSTIERLEGACSNSPDPIACYGKNFAKYKVVYEDPRTNPCQEGDLKCPVYNAMQCGGGFGPLFIKGGSARDSSVNIDPLYWEEPYYYVDASLNPFLKDEYFHAMSFWGYAPGAVYGATGRINEPCSVYGGGTNHYITILKAVFCSYTPTDGTPTVSWFCMTQCKP